jgi:hypothetical protein
VKLGMVPPSNTWDFGSLVVGAPFLKTCCQLVRLDVEPCIFHILPSTSSDRLGFKWNQGPEVQYFHTPIKSPLFLLQGPLEVQPLRRLASRLDSHSRSCQRNDGATSSEDDIDRLGLKLPSSTVRPTPLPLVRTKTKTSPIRKATHQPSP